MVGLVLLTKQLSDKSIDVGEKAGLLDMESPLPEVFLQSQIVLIFSYIYLLIIANPLREDNHELELSRVREKIKTKLVELIDYFKARENKLLRELDNILTSYLSYRSVLEKVMKRDII